MSDDIIRRIKERGSLVDEVLDTYLPIVPPVELYKASRHLVDAGGKRLRPATLILAAQMCGAKANDVLPAAVAVELVHNFTLIHDDIMDKDDLRRGLQAVHVLWGEPGAILAGDTLYSKAFEILADCNADPKRLVDVFRILSKTCTDICEGQWMDIDFENRTEVLEPEYITMVEKKTSVLYGAAAMIGGILAGASKEKAQALWNFGTYTGIGFQIFDDVLDLITPEDVLGKVRGSDIMEGKRTIIAIHAKEHGVDIPYFGCGGATTAQIEEALQVLDKAGSIEYANKKAVEYVENGKAQLDMFKDSEAKEILLELADYMISRTH